MNNGFLRDRQPRTFTGIGNAKEWKPIDYAVDRIRIKIVSGVINDVADLTAAVKAESIPNRLNKRDVRIKLKDVLLAEYDTPAKRSKMDSPAFAAAINPS